MSYYGPGLYYKHEFIFNGVTIDNDSILSGSLIATRSLIEGEQFALGGCYADVVEFDCLTELADQLSGQTCTYYIRAYSDEYMTEQVGEELRNNRLTCTKVTKAGNSEYKHVMLYDDLYKLNVDVSDVYANLFNTYGSMTLLEFKNRFLTAMGIPYDSSSGSGMVNRNMEIEQTVTGSFNGIDLLRALSVAGGGFGRINGLGNFEILGPPRYPGPESIYPSLTLYPSTSIYPVDASDASDSQPYDIHYASDDDSHSEYINFDYEDYETSPITGVTIRGSEDDVGATYGSTSNAYVISGNPFFFNQSAETLAAAARQIYEARLQTVKFTPATTSTRYQDLLSVGAYYTVENGSDSYLCFNAKEVISGVQGPIKTMYGPADEMLTAVTNQNTELIQLKGKSLTLIKTVEGLTTRVEELGSDVGDLSTEIEQTAESVAIKATQEGGTTTIESVLTLAANGISFEGGKVRISTDHFQVDVSSGGAVNIQSDPFVLTNESIEIHTTNLNVDADGSATFTGVVEIKNSNATKVIKLDDGVFSIGKVQISSGLLSQSETYTNAINFHHELEYGPDWGVRWYDNVTSIIGESGFQLGEYAYPITKLYVDDTEVNDSLRVGGDTTLSGNASVGGDLSVSGTATVTGDTTLSGNVDIGGYISTKSILTGLTVISNGSTYPGTVTQTVSFPYTFASAPNVVATPVTGVPGQVQVGVSSISTTGFTLALYRDSASGTGSTGVQWMAICEG